MKLELKPLLWSLLLAASAAHLVHAAEPAATTAPGDTPLVNGSNRVPVPDSGDTLILQVRAGKVTGGSVLPKGLSTAVPFMKHRFSPDLPLMIACPKPGVQECVAWTPPGGKTTITCYCLGNAAIKGAPMTLVNNTN